MFPPFSEKLECSQPPVDPKATSDLEVSWGFRVAHDAHSHRGQHARSGDKH